MSRRRLPLSFTLAVLTAAAAGAEPRVLDPGSHHLRIDGPREWEEFPETPEAARLELRFDAEPNAIEATLRLRQRDVKRNWVVRLNGCDLGTLRVDENDMVVCFAVPAGTLVRGGNVLLVEQTGARKEPDDVVLGPVTLDPRPMKEALSEATVAVSVIEEGVGPVPCRITILDADGVMQTPGAESGDGLAVRPGTIYTADGTARFGLPGGRYVIHAGRGFEYSLATVEFDLKPGDHVDRTLTIRREVPTAGWIACDTHVHSRTHSGHGDATVEERMVTIAGEGIELPVAADHNVVIDHDPFARAAGVRRHFTPVVGDEVTTKLGHFNVFPIEPGAEPPDHTGGDWSTIFEAIRKTPGVRAVVLNHARDLHSGYRPFGPGVYVAVAAEPLDGRPIGFDAMEVVNSGTTQNDPLRLFRDWMALLNAGHPVAAVGSSDSHDVARHFVGQGRTYVRGDDSDPGKIDVTEAVDALLAGRASVSYGLLAELTLDGRHGPGDLAPAKGDEVRVDVRVLGPGWTTADHVELFMNGAKVREAAITPGDAPGAGVKWAGGWTLPRPKHDAHFVAIASGPGVSGSYGKTAKPYQPTSPRFEPRVLGASGAAWLDADGDGRRTSAREYAERICDRTAGDLPALLSALAGHDEATAVHAARLHRTAGGSLTSAELRDALRDAAPAVRNGFQAYFEAWRESQTAAVGGPGEIAN